MKARYLYRDDAVARKMYHKLKNVPILIEYALTANIRTGEQVINSCPMYTYKKQYSHRQRDTLTETKQENPKLYYGFIIQKKYT